MTTAKRVALRIISEMLTLSGKFSEHHIHHEGSKAKIVHHPDGKTATVTGVHTPEHNRGKGHAHELMKKVTAHLDHHKRAGRLAAVAIDDGVTPGGLRKLYGHHGFKHEGNGIMKRPAAE